MEMTITTPVRFAISPLLGHVTLFNSLKISAIHRGFHQAPLLAASFTARLVPALVCAGTPRGGVFRFCPFFSALACSLRALLPIATTESADGACALGTSGNTSEVTSYPDRYAYSSLSCSFCHYIHRKPKLYVLDRP